MLVEWHWPYYRNLISWNLSVCVFEDDSLENRGFCSYKDKSNLCVYETDFDRMVRCWGIQFFFDILLFFSYIFFFSFIFLSVHFSNILSFIWIYFWMEKSNKTLWTQQTQKKKDTEILQDKVNLCLINRFLYLQCGFKYKRIR